MSSMPSKPELPPRDAAVKPRRASWWAIAVAVMLVMFFASGLVVLSMGMFGWVLALGLALFLFAAMHYLIWGWWLSGVIQRDVAREDAEQE